ncbi:MAG: response regulator [Chloroflexota bacterium]
MEPAAPQRHLTFLFADVEGSTRLAEQYATAGSVLARYHELVADVSAPHAGRVFERIGDGAYVVFDGAPSAVAAAVELQARVLGADWGEVGRLRVRVAVASGLVEERDERYFGRALFVAARIQSLARGGETFLGGETVAELAGALPKGTRLRDLGEQRLRDVAQPEHVYSLVRGGRRRAGEAPARVPAEGAADEHPIRVLIVDDHGVVRRGLRGFLELLDEIDIVGEAENGAEAVAAVSRLLPDVVLMDLQMPEMDGIQATAAIRQEHPDIAVVALTSFIEEHKVAAALEAGASGYLLKDAEADEVAGAIRRAARGEMHLDPAVGRLLTDRIRSDAP